MPSLAARRSVVILLALLGGLTSACLAPTLPPLPPPERPQVSAPVDGEAEVSGSLPMARANVLVWNHGQGEEDLGIIAGQRVVDGTYRFKIAAQTGDLLELWYLAEGEQSDGVTVVVPGPDEDDSSSDAGSQ